MEKINETKLNQERIKCLAAVLKSYSPGVASDTMIEHFTDRRDTNDTERIRDLVCAIADGILYGNWPWTKYEAIATNRKLKGKK